MLVRHSLTELSKLLILHRILRNTGGGGGDCVSYRGNSRFTSVLKGGLCWIKKHAVLGYRNKVWLTSAFDSSSLE